MNHNIKIQSEKFGTLLDETFVNPVQFKLFLRLTQSCVEMKQDLTFFNGTDFFIHIPYDKLKECIITPKVYPYRLPDYLRNKSQLDALETL